MKQFTQHILNKNTTQYQKFKFEIYLFWCEFNAVSQKDLQQLMISQQLLNWHTNQINLLEDEFIEKVSNGSTLGKTVLQINRIYIDTVSKISNFYPKNILLEIRKDAKKERFKNAFTLEHYAGKPLNLN